MATMNSVIEYVDGVKPNAYDDEVKYRWINTLEGLISREVHDVRAPEYNLQTDADVPLMVSSPYDDLYHLYVSAMIDFYNREYNEYNNTILMFKERLEQYKVWYIRNSAPSKPRNFRNVMG
jgi:hypothetical protein